MKPSLPKGTRDFGPIVMARRNYIFETIKKVFLKYGYQEIQTPAMENLSTLTGKYGDEGDKLIFKILNSGDYLGDSNVTKHDSYTLLPLISEKALRYDLTVPFARFVVSNRNDIPFPFKRFQIQPVWRADRPQKGRYREFYQCDADVVGSDSLLNEAEFILIYNEALKTLGLKDFTIKINNRKILAAIAEMLGKSNLLVDMTVAIDKLDKIGIEGVNSELLARGFTSDDLKRLNPLLASSGSNAEKLQAFKHAFQNSDTGARGIAEIETVLTLVHKLTGKDEIPPPVEIDITLARGLNYYTGTIFEVKSNEVKMGSIGGGGRYDDLTGMFDLKDLTGVGISFGADRIYDVMDELGLFPEEGLQTTRVLIANFDDQATEYALPLLRQLRQQGIAAELYPAPTKLKKQMSYADSKKIPYVILIGSEEIGNGRISLKNMQTGDQNILSIEEVISLLA